MKKKIKGGSVDIDGVFIQEKIKDLVDKGLQNELKDKYNNAYNKITEELKKKKELYELHNSNNQKQKDRTAQYKIAEAPKKQVDIIWWESNIWRPIRIFFGEIWEVFKNLFMSTGPMAHLVVFLLVLLIIYLIFYNVTSKTSSNNTPSGGNNISASFLNFFKGKSNDFDNYKYYNTGESNLLNLFLPTYISNYLKECVNNVYYKNILGVDINVSDKVNQKRLETIDGRSNNIINIDTIDPNKTYIILKPKNIKIEYTNFVNNTDLNNLPPEILDDNINSECDLTLNDKKNIYIDYSDNGTDGIYILDINNMYYKNKDDIINKLKPEEKFIQDNTKKIINKNNIKYPFIL